MTFEKTKLESRLGELFLNRKEAGKANLPVLSVTIAGGVVRRDSLANNKQKGDLVYNMMRMWQGASGIAEESGVVSPAYVVCQPCSRVEPRYVHHLFHTPRMIHLFWAYSHGITDDRRRLYFDDFCQFSVSLPPIEHQRRVAAALDAHDQECELLSRLIAAKQRMREGLVQNMLRGRKRFAEFGKSRLVATKLKSVLTKTASTVLVDPNGIYREIGIRSHGRGVFHKSPCSGSALGEKKVYKVIPRCLTLNIVFAWEGALPVTTTAEQGMVASHRFPMFRPDETRVVPEYLLYYMLSDLGLHALGLASPGGAGRNRTVSQEQFLKTQIPLPSLDEQRKIVEFVTIADAEIRQLKLELELLRRKKRGLMQRLLIGVFCDPEKQSKKAGKS